MVEIIQARATNVFSQHFMEEGLQALLSRKQRARAAITPVFDGENGYSLRASSSESHTILREAFGKRVREHGCLVISVDAGLKRPIMSTIGCPTDYNLQAMLLRGLFLSEILNSEVLAQTLL